MQLVDAAAPGRWEPVPPRPGWCMLRGSQYAAEALVCLLIWHYLRVSDP